MWPGEQVSQPGLFYRRAREDSGWLSDLSGDGYDRYLIRVSAIYPALKIKKIVVDLSADQFISAPVVPSILNFAF